MKKLTIAAALSASLLAAPAFACPGHDDAAPRTAEKAKDAGKATAKTETKDAKDTKDAKAKPADAAKPDKVSQK